MKKKRIQQTRQNPGSDENAGFTLVELLAVIAIIGILAAIIIPVAIRVRESARAAQGVSNLRQIGITLRTCANDNRDKLPWSGTTDTTEWCIELSGYLVGKNWNYKTTGWTQRVHPVFKDPAARIPGGYCHFGASPALMPWKANDKSQTLLSSVQNASRKVIIADIPQKLNGNAANAALDSATFTGIATIGYDRFDEAIPEGENRDGDGAKRTPRYRLRDNTAGKFLFVDGHVKILRIGELKYSNTVIE
jgi:prepilin-type N-terminal cleavage/methylation domain-containing protein